MIFRANWAMTDNNTGNGKDPSGAPGSPEIGEKIQDLASLDQRLRAIRRDNGKESGLAARIKAPPSNVLGLAFRVSVELVSALVVGAAIGWSLDYWLETRPWLMVVFIILGGAAGILNVYRLANGFGYAGGYSSTGSDGRDATDGDFGKRQ